MVTNSLVYMQLREAPTNRTYYRPSSATRYKRTYYYALTFCELAQLVVDPLLHALQVVRYLELAQGGAVVVDKDRDYLI